MKISLVGSVCVCTYALLILLCTDDLQTVYTKLYVHLYMHAFQSACDLANMWSN